MKQACQYVIVQFRPFVETGEFANVGIVLLCPEARYFDFQLMNKRYGRVTQFFHQLNSQIFITGMADFREELERVNALMRSEAFYGQRNTVNVEIALQPCVELVRPTVNVEKAQRIFAELVRPREGLLRFDMPRIVLAADPKAKLEELYDFYVERNFVTREYQERLLENKVGRLLYQAHLPFFKDKVGDVDFAVRFPFVCRGQETSFIGSESDEAKSLDTSTPNFRPEKGKVRGIIKPLHLAYDDSSKIFNHGGAWVDKIKRLKRRGQLPPQVLFAVKAPEQSAQRCFRAFGEIRDDLLDLNMTVESANDESRIIEVAKAMRISTI